MISATEGYAQTSSIKVWEVQSVDEAGNMTLSIELIGSTSVTIDDETVVQQRKHDQPRSFSVRG